VTLKVRAGLSVHLRTHRQAARLGQSDGPYLRVGAALRQRQAQRSHRAAPPTNARARSTSSTACPAPLTVKSAMPPLSAY